MLFSLVGDDVIRAMLRVARETPPGCFVEVGVYKGGTAQHLTQLAEEQGRSIFLYDTFTGIPYAEEFDTHKLGDFGDTNFSQVRAALPSATVVQGIFPESAVDMGPIAFVHLDCDQYRSYKDAFTYLLPRCQSGTVIWFDDFGCLEGANRAVHEQFGLEQLILNTECNKTYVRL